MAKILDPEHSFKLLKDGVVDVLKKEYFPNGEFKGKKRTLRLASIEAHDNTDFDDFTKQQEVGERDGTWSIPLRAKFDLIDNASGKKIDSKTLNVAQLPKLTPRFSYLVDGKERQVDHQSQLKDGIFTRVPDNGAFVESVINTAGPDKRRDRMRVAFDPETHKYTLKHGTTNVNLLPVLNALGVEEDQIKKSWGKEIAEDNRAGAGQADLVKLYKSFYRKAPESDKEMFDGIREKFSGLSLDPEVTSMVVGKEHKQVTGEALLDSATAALKITRGEVKPTGYDDMRFKRALHTEDYVPERLRMASKGIKAKIAQNIDRVDDIEKIVARDTFNKPVKQFFNSSQLSVLGDQTNPLGMITGHTKHTIMGEGGISSPHQVSMDAKIIHPSSIGFLDPLHTPESSRTGINLQLPMTTWKDGNELVTAAVNAKTGKLEKVRASKLASSNLAFPDQFIDMKPGKKPKPVGREVTVANRDGEMAQVKPGDVDYILPSHASAFSVTTNLIPFLQNNNGNRVGYSTQQQHQALSLRDREAPLVQSATTRGEDATTFEDVVGKVSGHNAKTSGVVTKVTDRLIEVKGIDGKKVKHHLYKHFPLNNKKGYLSSEATVKPGDTVKKGQSIADNNFMKDGKLALGTNLTVGYVPADGYNFEDGIVISESAAQKLTSKHMYKKEFRDTSNSHIGARKFRSHYPTAYKKEQMENMGDDGIIREGAVVKPGDPLLLAVRKNEVTSEAEGLAKLSKGLVKDWKDASLTWEGDTEGKVVKVVRTGKKVKVHVRADEAMQVGDKLVGRHGNKGICFPLEDHEVMTADGWKGFDQVTEQDQIATLNPDTHAIEYQRPTRTVLYEHKGELVKIGSRHVELRCTPEHQLFVQWGRQEGPFELKEAQELVGKRVRMKKGGIWVAQDVLRHCLPVVEEGLLRQNYRKEVPGDAWIRFLGYYVTEGFRSNTSGQHYVYICQDVYKNPEVTADIAACLDELGFSYSFLEDRRFRIASVQLYNILKECGDGAINKQLPPYVLQWSPRQLSLLWDALVAGDGHKDKKTGAEAFYSCSYKLVSQAQEILLKIGYSGNVLTHIEKGTVIFGEHRLANTCYRVNKNRSTNYVTVDPKKKGDTFALVRGFSGPVGCVEVPNHVIYVRNNGKAVWVGNCTKILPDHEMPKFKDQITGEDKNLQVMLNPMGVPGRINPGQTLETAASWIAKKTGKTYKVKNFDSNSPDYSKKVQDDLKKHGLSDTSELTDPKTGKKIGRVLVGDQHMLKLDQQVSKKMSARSAGYGNPYDVNKAPTTGGGRLGSLGNYAMLAHGAVHNLREMQTYKSSVQDDVWRAIQQGDAPPTPRAPYAYDKLEGYMKGMGVNVSKEGNQLVLEPLTDKHVAEMSNGEVKDPGRMIRGKDLKSEKGGLFDPKVFGRDGGGLKGTKWGHIELDEPMPNPVFEKAILTLTGMKGKEFSSVLAGEKEIEGKTGPKAIGAALDNIDVKERLKDLRAGIKKAPKSKIDLMNRQIRYLQNLDKLGISPREAYMRKKVPILPPIMRPLSALEDGSLNTDDLNALYKGVGLINSKLKDMDPDLKQMPEETSKLHTSLYDGMKALTGVGTLPDFHYAKKQRLRSIAGKLEGKDPHGKGQVKEGFFQKTVMSRKQDLSMRSTIVPNQRIKLDEVAIPKEGAQQIFKPHLVRELRGLGLTTLQAHEAIKTNDKRVDVALERVMKDTPVLLKRDPVLHKFGVMAFKPKLSQGRAIEIHPLVTGGFNADFDGDLQNASVFVVLSKKCNADLVDNGWGVSYSDENVEGVLTRIGDPMAARFYEQVACLDKSDELFMCYLEDFPRLANSGRKAHDDADFYEVPTGVRVLSWDEKDGRIKAVPIKWWSAHRQKEVEIVRLRSGRDILTDDDERAVYGIDPNTLEYRRCRPQESRGLFVPTAKKVSLLETRSHLELEGSSRLKPRVDVGEDLGYLLGLLVGDGWVAFLKDRPKAISLAVSDNGVVDGFNESLLSVFWQPPVVSLHKHEPDSIGSFMGSQARYRHTVTCASLARSLLPLIGKGANKKHLPPVFMVSPEEFRRGLLAGLIDTDGSISQSKAKKKPQWMVSYCTTSMRLAYEVSLLCKSLGITASLSPGKTPGGNPVWTVTLSTVETHRLGSLPVRHTGKQKRFAEFFSAEAPASKGAYSRYNIVPMGRELASSLRSFLGTEKLTQSEYVILSKVKDRHYLSKEAALTIIDKADGAGFKHHQYARWVSLVRADVSWDPVVSYEKTGIIEDGYDLTVPGYETFMSVDGVVLSNTMAAFAPITTEAKEEAKRMLPSNNLFDPKNGSTQYTPGHEAMAGIHRLSQPGKKTGLKFANEQEAAKALEADKIRFDDQIKIGGRPTTIGKAMLDRALPKDMRGRIADSNKPVDKKFMGQMLKEIANNNPKAYPDVVQAWKDLGNDTATKTGMTLSLDDIRSNTKLRNDFFAPYKKKEAQIRATGGLSRKEKEKKIVDLYRGSIEKWDKVMYDDLRKRGSSMMSMLDSGGMSGSKRLAVKQMSGAPIMFEDAKGEVIPVPVLKSYSEGLGMADYMTGAQGARMGTLSKSQGTSAPGALSKRIINSTMNILVSKDDCKTSKGVLMDVKDPDLVDRYTATSVKAGRTKIPAGTLLTADVRDKLRSNGVSKVHVRTPLKCAHGEGVCQKCAGLGDDGRPWDIGTNLGVIAAQSMGEPTTQMSMNSFHTGGVVSPPKSLHETTVKGDTFTNMRTLLFMPSTIQNSAKLAPTSGKISNIRKDPAGGHRVFVAGQKGAKDLWVPELKRGIQTGKTVKAGDPLSPGMVNPRELLPLAGLDAVKGSLTNQIHGAYGGATRRRHIEVAVRAMTDLAKVKDAGDQRDVLPGDVMSASQLNALNAKLKPGQKPAVFQPVLKGMEQLPLEMQEDWAARMNFTKLKDTVVEGALKGWKSDIHGRHPVPGMMYGAEFGRDTNKKSPY